MNPSDYRHMHNVQQIQKRKSPDPVPSQSKHFEHQN